MHAALPHRVVASRPLRQHDRMGGPAAMRRFSFNASWRACAGNGSLCRLGPATVRERSNMLYSVRPDTDVFVLGNHGLVVGGEDAESCRKTTGRSEAAFVHPSPQGTPGRLCGAVGDLQDSPWDLPDDDEVHALGTDAISRAILRQACCIPARRSFRTPTPASCFARFPVPIGRTTGSVATVTAIPDY